jgi:hypothetical protein
MDTNRRDEVSNKTSRYESTKGPTRRNIFVLQSRVEPVEQLLEEKGR